LKEETVKQNERWRERKKKQLRKRVTEKGSEILKD
jgi:hypothetical protein